MAVLEKAYEEGLDLAACLNVAIKACKAFRGDTTVMDITVVTKAGMTMGERVPVSNLKSFLSMPPLRRLPGQLCTHVEPYGTAHRHTPLNQPTP